MHLRGYGMTWSLGDDTLWLLDDSFQHGYGMSG
jgi:hypothetical protein